MTSHRLIRGRFAPSPTGPLHLGSLLAAVASFLSARHQQGEWLVRMEDLDQPRCDPGHATGILHTLEAFGLHWDGSVVYQSNRDTAYQRAVQKLQEMGMVYPCVCSRRDVAEVPVGIDGPVYPGTCRGIRLEPLRKHALRVCVDDSKIGFIDGIQGHHEQTLTHDVGDFVIRRSDDLYAYQLAVVIDDAEQGITEVVRGVDLLTSTPRQIFLQRRLNLPQPTYLHVPLLVNNAGEKLSKQNHAPPVDHEHPPLALMRCLRLLGQAPPTVLDACSGEEVLAWAVENWDPLNIPRFPSLPAVES